MIRYVRVFEQKVAEIILEFDPSFPHVPFKDRYSSAFVSSCVKVTSDSTVIEQGMTYDPSTKTFYFPKPPKVAEPNMPKVEEQNIAEEQGENTDNE